MRATRALAFLALACPPVLASAAGDPVAGQQKAAQVCAACHGADGNSPNGQFPNLAGQYEDYLIHALQAYQNGQRKNPVMAGMAQPLTAKEIADVSAYYASQKGLRIAR